mmetsp:Transcript_411/g.1181  ORF Transcript_411/g.1181 Transcript_411/m.1181 type:complete len:291 (+) Transcript_411:339-1211(+)
MCPDRVPSGAPREGCGRAPARREAHPGGEDQGQPLGPQDPGPAAGRRLAEPRPHARVRGRHARGRRRRWPGAARGVQRLARGGGSAAADRGGEADGELFRGQRGLHAVRLQAGQRVPAAPPRPRRGSAALPRPGQPRGAVPDRVGGGVHGPPQRGVRADGPGRAQRGRGGGPPGQLRAGPVARGAAWPARGHPPGRAAPARVAGVARAGRRVQAGRPPPQRGEDGVRIPHGTVCGQRPRGPRHEPHVRDQGRWYRSVPPLVLHKDEGGVAVFRPRGHGAGRVPARVPGSV